MTTPFIVRKMLLDELGSRESNEAKLNPKPHFVPLGTDILEKIIGPWLDPKKMTVGEFRQAVIDYITTKHRKSLYSRGGLLYTQSGELVTGTNIFANTPAVVYSGKEILGALYSAKDSFASIQRGLFGEFLNKGMQKFLKVNRTNYAKGFDVGHTIVETESGSLAQTPLTEGLSSVTNLAAVLKNDITDTEQRRVIDNVLLHLNTLQGNFEIHADYGQTINASLTKSFKKSLLSVNANIVIIQDRRENQGQFSKLEQKLKQQILKAISEVHFSNSIREEVGTRVLAAMAGKKVKDTQKTVKLDPIKKQSKVLKVTTGATKLTNLTTKRQIGLPSLLALINSHLHDVVAANMGDGNSRNVLNYRTGRFATSTKVERLTANREGAITAYYSYMKNPYATFSEGGRQDKPRSRDPKLLISKSIREIAAKYVANQLRAVNV